jgi:hypothetical protein
MGNILSALRAQQVNAIYRFVTMAHQYNHHSFGYYPSFCLLFKTLVRRQTSSFYYSSRLYLKTETESSLQNFMYLNKTHVDG